MNIDAKNPEQNKFKSTFKGPYTVIKWVLFLGCKDGLTYANK